jgi:hypothetical protein
MAAIRNDMIVRKMPWHSNMTELNHLGKALRIKPEVFTSKIDQMFSSYIYSENNFTANLIGTGRVKESESNDWTWELKGAHRRPLVVLESYVNANITKVGQYGNVIRVKFDGPDWKPGDIISPMKPSVQLRVQSKDPGNAGAGGWIYTLELFGAKTRRSALDATYLKAGQKWTKLFSQYEEGTNQAGSVTFSENFELKSRLSRYRKRYEITGDAHNTVLASKIRGADGKMYPFWIKYAEAEFWQQWYKELETGIWYSRTDDNVKGSTGRPIYSGPGIQQLMEKSHQHTYSVLTGKLIREFVMDIVYARTKPGEKRDFVAVTGEYGMIQFSEVVAAELKAQGFILSDDYFVDKMSTPFHSNGLAMGAQFVKYRMYNGATMTLMHNPLYDDPDINGEIDPVTGYPKESMRYTFLDVAGEGSDSNITLVRRKKAYKVTYVEGTVGPYGPKVNESSAHDGDYYSMTVQDQRGVHIHDISRCGELILGR